MAENSLKHLRRKELIEIIYQLQEQEKQYQAQLAEMEKKLSKDQYRLMENMTIEEAQKLMDETYEFHQMAAASYYKLVKKEAYKEANRILLEAQQNTVGDHTEDEEKESEGSEDSEQGSSNPGAGETE